MFRLLKLILNGLAQPYKITDQESCRAFMLEMIALLKPLAEKTGNEFDNAFLKQLEFIVQSDALFAYVYRLIRDQLQTEEILVESADKKTVATLIPASVSVELEAVNPAVIVSLITQIITLINTIKNQ